MKIFFYLILLITAANCGGSQQTETAKPSNEEVAQEAPEEQNDMLIGEIELKELQQPPFAAWFDPMYKSYKPNEQALQTIQENINNYDIKLFMGTWCADSQREVPKFYKLLELSDYDLDRLEVQAVREDKTLPDQTEEEYDIEYVPTIIFLKDGEEVGRFVEYPQEELEQDIAKIVSGKEYRHSYE